MTETSAEATSQGLTAESGVLSQRVTIPLAFTALSLFLMSSSAPTPIYRIYQADFGLTPFMITVIFGAYSFGLLTSLLTVGSLSDHLGRRPVVLGALAVNALAMLIFVFAHSVALLIVARLIQGFGSGVAATAIGAAMTDLAPTRAPTLNATAPFTGLTIGAVGAGALVTYAPAPEHTVYVILLAISLALIATLWRMPETARAELGALASLLPRLHVPPAARQALLAVSPVNIAAWSLSGFYFSLVPALVRVATGLTSPLIGAGVVSALTVTAILSVFMARGWKSRTALSFGALVLASGTAVIVIGVHLQSVAVILGGSLFTGFSFGAIFGGALRTLLPLARPDERAGLLSAFYVESYLAFSVPAIIAGLVAPRIGLPATAIAAGIVVIVLALLSFVLTRLSAKREASAS